MFGCSKLQQEINALAERVTVLEKLLFTLQDLTVKMGAQQLQILEHSAQLSVLLQGTTEVLVQLSNRIVKLENNGQEGSPVSDPSGLLN